MQPTGSSDIVQDGDLVTFQRLVNAVGKVQAQRGIHIGQFGRWPLDVGRRHLDDVIERLLPRLDLDLNGPQLFSLPVEELDPEGAFCRRAGGGGVCEAEPA